MTLISQQEYNKIFSIVYREQRRIAPDRTFSFISYELVLGLIAQDARDNDIMSDLCLPTIGWFDFSMIQFYNLPNNRQKSINLKNFRFFNQIASFGKDYRMSFSLRRNS